MTDYQYGVRDIIADKVMSVPTDDQGVLPSPDFDPVVFKELYGGVYELVRREVGGWESVV